MINKALMNVGRLIYRVGLSGPIIRLGKKNPKILLFHDISPKSCDFLSGLGTTLHPETFRAHLDFLVEHYDIVPVDRLHAPTDRPRVSIAFDDGYKSVHQFAAPILREHDATAIVYLITRAVDNVEPVWVNELNWHLRRGGEPALGIARKVFCLSANADAAEIISAARVDFDRDKIRELTRELENLNGRTALDELASAPIYLTWNEVSELAGQGFVFGNHTATHPNMARLSDEEQSREIGEAQETLKRNGVETSHFAYPFGHHNSKTGELARRHGLRWIAEVGGDNLDHQSGFVGRVDISATSAADLFAQLEVVEPVKSLLRKILRKPKAGWA